MDDSAGNLCITFVERIDFNIDFLPYSNLIAAPGGACTCYAGAPCKGRAAPLQSRSPPDPAFSIRKLRPVKARVHVTLKPGILDPQGKAIQHALAALGFAGVEAVRQGKVIDLEIAERDPEAARVRLREMCEKLLANTVIENYTIELDAASDGSDAPVSEAPR